MAFNAGFRGLGAPPKTSAQTSATDSAVGRNASADTIPFPSPHAGGLIETSSVKVPLGLGGTLGAPRVEVRADDAVRGLVSGQARQARKAIRNEAESRGRKAVEGLFDRLGGKAR